MTLRSWWPLRLPQIPPDPAADLITEMPPRPPRHREPGAGRAYPNDTGGVPFTCPGLDAQFDPCGAPPVKTAPTRRSQ